MEQPRTVRPTGQQVESKPIGRLLQDSSLYLVGNAASRVVGFLAIPFYSRFLSPAQYGLIELIELSTQTVAIAFGLQAIGAALGRLFHDQRTPEGEQAVVSTSLILTAVLSAAVTIVALAGSRQLSLLVFHSEEWASLLQAAFTAMFFGNLIEVVLVYERIQNRARFFLAYTFYTLVTTLLLNVVFIGFLGAGVWGFVSSKLVVTSLGSAYLILRVQREVGWRWRGMLVPPLVKFGAPLILSSLSYFAIHFSDRFFLSSAVSLAELGRYALAYRFAILVSALVGDSFTKSWNVTFYRYVERPDWRERFTEVAAYFTYALFATGLAIALFSPELLRIMVPKSYFPPPFLLPIVILSYLAREIGDFFRTLLLINKRSVVASNIAGGAALLNLAANFVLIPAYGTYGAAFATLLTWGAYMLVCWRIANAEHALPVPKAAYVRLFLLVCGVYLLAEATRVRPFVVQGLLDGVWTLVFCAAAAWLFLRPGERWGVLGLGGTLLARLLTLGLPGPGVGRGPEVLLLADDGAVGVTRSRFRGALSGVLGVAGRLAGPGVRAGWVPHGVAEASGRVTRETVLLSRGAGAGHMAALTLKHRYGLPWVADLGDAAAGRAAGLLERAVVENADAVVVGSGTASMLRGRYPGGRIHVVTEGGVAGVIDAVRAEMAVE